VLSWRTSMDGAGDILLRHGYAVLFGWVFAEQIGLPIPAVPVLMAAGALAGTGRLSLAVVLAAAGVASLVSDTIWYWIGRTGGGACSAGCAGSRSSQTRASGALSTPSASTAPGRS